MLDNDLDQWYFMGTNKIHKSVAFFGEIEMGENNIFYPNCVIGIPGFIRKSGLFEGKVTIGDDNWFGCNVSVMIGKSGETKIGNNNLIMNYVNIGHNVSIGDNNEIGVNSVIAGWAEVGNKNKIKLSVSVRNRKIIGNNCLIGMGSVVVKDVQDDCIIYGNPAKVREKKL
jgi:acyl-[acyl carrier protein]--UDP-N-acetylglucosamine O-acyltransferase